MHVDGGSAGDASRHNPQPLRSPKRCPHDAAMHQPSFFGHPRGLSTLFFTELWERFSYYGMRGLLILYMTAPLAAGGLGYDVATAGAVYGLYAGSVYLTCLPGGWLADRFLGTRAATRWGGLLILSGHVCLAMPLREIFFLGLALVVSGTGLLKPSVSTLVGGLYAPDDPRRDAGYSLYYMGINLGAFLAPLACGWLALGAEPRRFLAGVGIAPETAWHVGFGAAALGMLLGLVQFMRGTRHLAGVGDPPTTPREDDGRRLRQGGVALLGLVLLLGALLWSGQLSVQRLSDGFALVLLGVTAAFFLTMFRAGDWTPAERNRLRLILLLFVAAAVFWSLFEQGGSTLTLFAARNTDLILGGHAFPATWFQSVNPLLIIALAPVFAWGWVKLGARNPGSVAKFILGLVLVAAGFAVLVPAAQLAVAGEKVSPWWLVATYTLHTLGELCLSPVGLSAMSRLAPARIASLTMGVWFLASAVGNYLGGRVAGLYERFTLPELFGSVALAALVAAGVMLALLPAANRLLAPRAP